MKCSARLGAAVGLDGGAGSCGTSSGLLWARQHRRVRVGSHGRAEELRSRSSGRSGKQSTGAAGPGHCTEMAHGRGLEECEGME